LRPAVTLISIPSLVLVAVTALGCKSAGTPAAPAPAVVDPDLVEFNGMCDASGAVPLGGDRFAVADDEDNVLRVYDARRGGPPLHAVDISAALPLPHKKKTPETDLEAATRLGDLALWITSHGRNSSGKARPERLLLFATTAVESAFAPGRMQLVGKPCTTLLEQLLAAPHLAALPFEAAATRAPKDPGGMNIEGLTATPDGRVLIGFRNPIPEGRAIVLPLDNPRQVIDGAAAHFGDPIRFDLGGLGVRSLSFWRGRYLIAAGPFAEDGPRRLYSWSGTAGDPPRLEIELRDINPEGFFSSPTADRVMLLSDDGSRSIDGEACKSLVDPARKRFRGRWVTLPSRS
jgi:hypothetical protein